MDEQNDSPQQERKTYATFTEHDKKRLRDLDAMHREIRKEKLKKLRPWETLLSVIGLFSFSLIFVMPKGRGTSFIDYLFFVMVVVTMAFIFLVFRWKNQIFDVAWAEFTEKHGKEHERLLRRQKASKDGTTADGDEFISPDDPH